MDSAPAPTGTLTPTQLRVVAARGNVLVMAGAGTGKTRTLIERCVNCLEHDGASIDELLVVTFTEAAAAEMRERLRRAMEARAEIEAKAKASAGADETSPVRSLYWAEQLARFDLAHIGTLHGFCLRLVREHFYELGLDPHLTVLPDGEARQLANETLDEQFAGHYAGVSGFSAAVLELIQIHGGGRDDAIRKLVLQLHHYSQARPDAAGWLAEQRKKFSSTAPEDWSRWLPEAIVAWRAEWLPVLNNLEGANEKAAELARLVSRLPGKPAGLFYQAADRDAVTSVLAGILSADGNWPAKKKTLLRKPVEDIFEEAEFLHSLVETKGGCDPLVEDWSWVRTQMETLLRLAEEFAQKLAERKQALGALDFHDLEQYALKLLWDTATGRPTAVAAGWREALKFVFVDEYQDINAAQDRIIQGLSRGGDTVASPGNAEPDLAGDAGKPAGLPQLMGAAPQPNRFLVGDVKQSIYRFRLADPKIFRDYARTWHGAAGQTIPLAENFRSRESLLSLVNSVFRLIMRKEVGGVAYDRDAELKFGSPETRPALGSATDNGPRAEMLLRFTRSGNAAREDEGGELAALDDTQREARLLAHRIRDFVAEGREVFDDGARVFRRVEWRDVAVLLRSPKGRSDILAREFALAGVPLAVARGGFYESAEILDLLSLLQLLDNPLQDVPCIAVLRSPLVGLSLDELAEIRLAAPKEHFWTALNRSVINRPEKAENKSGADAGTHAKVTRFLDRMTRWRKLARLASLSQCLEEILAETLYVDWLRGQGSGAQRAANVAGLLNLAHQFDQFQRQGLFRFLKYVAAQQEIDAVPDVPAVAAENAVRLMSIHQSKGLEFPVVVLADLAKQFNERDLRGDIIFDEQFGLCPKIKPPDTGRKYPSLPHWLAQRRQKRELRGEELRLFYVALTRARDYLILSASIAEKSWAEKWCQPQALTPHRIVAAKSFADWLGQWFANQPENQNVSANQTNGATGPLAWRIVDDAALETGAASKAPATGEATAVAAMPAMSQEELATLRGRLEWTYPHRAATRRRAKASVTALRREAQAPDAEAEALFRDRREVQKLKAPGGKSTLSASEIGAAHHRFLQLVALEKTDDLAGEADRLERMNYLSVEERAVLDLMALGKFWNSPLGGKVRAHAGDVRRELPFTARFSPEEITALTGVPAEVDLEQEFVIVQGVADLVVVLPREIWLVDFKTDELSKRDLAAKKKIYEPQLKLYAAALEKIFGRAVTVRALHFLATGQTEKV